MDDHDGCTRNQTGLAKHIVDSTFISKSVCATKLSRLTLNSSD